ncbi:hypothetical protein [Kaarinaea lacus]
MNNTTTKLVTETRLRKLLDCYGSDPSGWPEDERQAALSLLKGMPELKDYRDEIRTLDKLLEKQQTRDSIAITSEDIQSLQDRIMDRLPEQQSSQQSNEQHESDDRVIHISQADPVKESHASRNWLGSIAAGLFIVSLSVGVLYQLFGTDVHTTDGRVAVTDSGNTMSNEFIQWAWEDVTGESLVADNDSDPATLLALVELEFPVE